MPNERGGAGVYGGVLQAADLGDDEDTFAVRSSSEMPNEMPGASALIVNAHDTRAISDTIVVYPDAATATATLRQATATADATELTARVTRSVWM